MSMSEWQKYKLGEVYSFSSGLSKSSDQFGYGFDFLTFKDVFNNYFLPDKLTALVNSTEKERQTSSIKRGDVFLTRTSETDDELGMSSVALKDYPNATFNGFTKRLRPLGNVEIYPEFVAYYFRSPRFRANIVGMSSITTRASLNNSMLAELPLLLPNYEEQVRIATILKCLDDKIDLLHRENTTLEAMADTLFRQWFIEEVKEDWEEGAIADFAEHYKASVIPRNNPIEMYYHYSIPAFDTGKEPILEQGENIQSNKYLVPKNCILFSKLNPHKDKRVWIMLDNIPDNAICSTEFQIVKPTNLEYLYFLYGWLTNKENYDEIASGVGGTSGSHQRIDPKTIFSYSCPQVDMKTIRNYNKCVEPLFYKQRNNQQQIQTLIQQRDSLLPNLMSSEVEI